MDANAADALVLLPAEAPRPAGDRRHAFRPLPLGNARSEANKRVLSRLALAEPGPSPPDRDLDLDHRLQPVDVGALQESDLDKSHDPGRIAGAATAARPRRRFLATINASPPSSSSPVPSIDYNASAHNARIIDHD